MTGAPCGLHYCASSGEWGEWMDFSNKESALHGRLATDELGAVVSFSWLVFRSSTGSSSLASVM